MTRLDEQRELSSLGGQKARAIDRGEPERVIRDIDRQITLIRAQRAVRKALDSVPASDRAWILEKASV